MSDQIHSHLSAKQIQAFLEGELPSRKVAVVEEHLAACATCAAELEGWQVLLHDLDDLATHRPREGFAERVMTDVRRRSHVTAGVLQDFLEGTLPGRRAERVERHLAGCRPCASEAEAWTAVLRRLDELGSLAPSEGFRELVMSGVELPGRAPLAARIRSRVASVWGSIVRGAGAPAPEHVPPGILQDFVDGALPETAVARVEAHVDGCGRCAGELDAWSFLAERLGSLERFEPAESFEDRVMVGLRTARALGAVTEPDPAWVRGLRAARSAARRLVPETRQLVAALSGAAVAPMVVIGLIVWALASHPTLTVGSLSSFVWWQVGDLAATTFAAVSSVALQSAEVFGLYSLLETLAAAPAMVAGGVLVYTAFCALALRVLYRNLFKNLFANRPSGGRHAHVSTAS